MKFIFDLDGTLTSEETLPIIAKEFHLEDQIEELTINTLNGKIPFLESFTKRIDILGDLPISKINSLLESVNLHKEIVKFIRENIDNCIIATGNFKEWVEGLIKKIGCKYYSSEGVIKSDKIIELTHILKKEIIVDLYKERGEFVTFIGDSNNDIEAMRRADISITTGITHSPAIGTLKVATHSVFTEYDLIKTLNKIKQQEKYRN